jgi:large subunit ribosomal protein L10e
MAKLKRAVAHRYIERPYTRVSKYRSKQYVRAKPVNKVVKFEMGNLTKKFEYTVILRSKSDLQIRHNALESARLTSNRLLESKLGRPGFKLKLRVYPHHILRENPLAAGAGADRMSTGMKKSFGKPIGLAAQVRIGQAIIEAHVDAVNLETAKKAVSRAKYKIPCSCKLEIIKNV